MNNFNCNKEGIDIELNVSYDTFISQSDWTENFNEVVSTGHRTSGIYQYTEWGNIKKMDSSDYLAIHKDVLKRDLLTVALDVDWNWYTKTEIRAMKKEELVDLIQDDVILNDYDFKEAIEWASDNNIMLVIDDYEIISTRGHSQGDYAEVIVLNGDVDLVKDDIDHFFWDAPISARGVVNGEEFYIDEHMENIYEWDKDEAMGIVATKFDFDKDVITAICEMLPESPSYD